MFNKIVIAPVFRTTGDKALIGFRTTVVETVEGKPVRKVDVRKASGREMGDFVADVVAQVLEGLPYVIITSQPKSSLIVSPEEAYTLDGEVRQELVDEHYAALSSPEEKG